MKKLAIILTMFIILMSETDVSTFSLLDYFEGEYSVYTKIKINDNSLYNGELYITQSQVKLSENVCGECLLIYDFEPISALNLLNAKVVKTDLLTGGETLMSAYTSKIKTYKIIKNQKVNLQIKIDDGYCLIGWPTINNA